VTVKRGWEESTSGPDWIDVEGLMRAIGGLHCARVEFTVSPDGIGFGTGLTVTALATIDVLPGSLNPREVSRTKAWPNAESSTLVVCVFRLLYDLDYAIGEEYKQTRLFQQA